MKYITTGQYRSDAKRKWEVMVDDEDYEYLSQYNWHVSKDKCVASWLGGHNKRVLLHRFIMKPPDDMEIDHIDGNRLNNQKSNLRLATSSQNKCNRGPRKDNKSGFKGVSWHKQREKWTARIKSGEVYKHLGLFESKEEAAKTYNNAAIRFQGQFAYLNKIV